MKPEPVVKLISTLVIMLLAVVSVRADSSFSEALATLNTNLLGQTFELRKDRIHEELVIETIYYAKLMNVTIEKPAAVELDEIYSSASEVAVSESDTSENFKLFPANRIRFIAHLISKAQPREIREMKPAELLITTDTIKSIERDLTVRLKSLCPCWPFCK